MMIVKMIALLLPFWFTGYDIIPDYTEEDGPVEITYKDGEQTFNKEQKEQIGKIIFESEADIRKLLPTLPNGIRVELEIVDWDIEVVGGVTGRTETNNPPLVILQISHVYPGGLNAAINDGLKSTVYHEFHHLSRGWAIQDNKYGPGIDIATVNEGLAEVFAETYTGAAFEASSPPEDGDSWMKEILALPTNASYSDWMFEHPDGRRAIGYRTGNYLIRKAIATSGMDILELSSKSPENLIELAGY
ncbi:MAG: DUF2268 domain-containing protein [Eudoraea sp.]|nr:DUF2268 domain-containing protein [Eudoraea sp.]NNK30110.1 hypothetical protein [Flavobacteriaceae bacterium]